MAILEQSTANLDLNELGLAQTQNGISLVFNLPEIFVAGTPLLASVFNLPKGWRVLWDLYTEGVFSGWIPDSPGRNTYGRMAAVDPSNNIPFSQDFLVLRPEPRVRIVAPQGTPEDDALTFMRFVYACRDDILKAAANTHICPRFLASVVYCDYLRCEGQPARNFSDTLFARERGFWAGNAAKIDSASPDLNHLDYWDHGAGICRIPILLVAIQRKNLLNLALAKIAEQSKGTWVLNDNQVQQLVLGGTVQGWSLTKNAGEFVDWVNLARFSKSNILVTAKILDALSQIEVKGVAKDSGTLVGGWGTPQAITDERVRQQDDNLLYLLAAFDRLRSFGSVRKVSKPSFATRVMQQTLLPLMDLFFNVDKDYGGFALQKGDGDDANAPSEPVYGGIKRQFANTTHYVSDLVGDLRHLGFATAGYEIQGNGAAQSLTDTPGSFEEPTDWAVREFQTYAGMDRVATIQDAQDSSPQDGDLKYTKYLNVVDPNPIRYVGPVTGVANIETRAVIQYWKRHYYRCPVIIRVYDSLDIKRTNFWYRRDGIDSFTPNWTFVAYDFTRYFQEISTVNGVQAEIDACGALVPTGRIGFKNNLLLYEGGPYTRPKDDTFATAAITWEKLTGTAWPVGNFVDGAGNTLATNDASVSTMRVILATAVVEAGAKFDAVNGYDSGIISVGFYQWTLGSGELCALFSFLHNQYPLEFKRLFRRFGIIPSIWGVDPILKKSERKYSGQLYSANESGEAMRLKWNGNQLTTDFDQSWQAADSTKKLSVWSGPDLEYFRLLPLFYRFLMGTRISRDFRRAMWDMARMRLRDLMGIIWPDQPNDPDYFFKTDAQGVRSPVSLTEIFSSELTMAIILRWHVNRPGDIANGNRPAEQLKDALWRVVNRNPGIFRNAAGDAIRDISQWNWGANDELVVATSLNAYVQSLGGKIYDSIKDSIPKVINWAGYTETDPANPANVLRLGKPSSGRGSFHMDLNGLPPAPPV